MTPGLLDIQHGALQDTNTTTLATKLLNDIHTQDGYVALLDVAKAFPSVPQSMLTNIVKEARALETIIRMLGEIYQHSPAVLSLHACDLPLRPTRGTKEGCPLSPTLFLLYYDIVRGLPVMETPQESKAQGLVSGHDAVEGLQGYFLGSLGVSPGHPDGPGIRRVDHDVYYPQA